MLITEVVDAMRRAQEAGHKVLAFVIPVTEEALYNCGLSAATVDDRVQQAIIATLNETLGGEHAPLLARTPDPAHGQMVPLTDRDIEDLTFALKHVLPKQMVGLLTASEVRRRQLLSKLLIESERRENA